MNAVQQPVSHPVQLPQIISFIQIFIISQDSFVQTITVSLDNVCQQILKKLILVDLMSEGKDQDTKEEWERFKTEYILFFYLEIWLCCLEEDTLLIRFECHQILPMDPKTTYAPCKLRKLFGITEVESGNAVWQFAICHVIFIVRVRIWIAAFI